MKHARSDYARIQDPAANTELLAAYDVAMTAVARGPDAALVSYANAAEELRHVYRVLSTLCRLLTPTLAETPLGNGSTPIAVDEPVFVLRARDKFAPNLIRAWARQYFDATGDGTVPRALSVHAAEMEVYANKKGGAKTPDIPPSALSGRPVRVGDPDRSTYGGDGSAAAEDLLGSSAQISDSAEPGGNVPRETLESITGAEPFPSNDPNDRP